MYRGIVAIVGAPNSGKSSLFNRISGTHLSIVADDRGITRDRIYSPAEWLGETFDIIDTGGIEIANTPFQEEIRAQVEIAIEQADLIIFLVDGKSGVTPDDEQIAQLLYRVKKPIILAVNKIDGGDFVFRTLDFYSLGLGDPIGISSIHGVGIGDLLDDVIRKLPKKEDKEYKNAITFTVIGRPNVGKSSLVNALLGEERVIVSDIEGTTRDAIDTPFTRDGRDYVVIDTAGLKKRGKIYESIDKYAAIRALSAIDKADVCVLVIDGAAGLAEQDKHVLGYAIDKNKAIVIVVNKWDAVKNKDQNTMNEFKKDLLLKFKFADYANIIFLSAKTTAKVPSLFPAIEEAFDSYHYRMSTSILNDIMQDLQVMNPAPEFNGGRLKIYYASQVAICPPTFALFVNDPNYLHFSYLRYIENRLRTAHEMKGSPLRIVLRKRK